MRHLVQLPFAIYIFDGYIEICEKLLFKFELTIIYAEVIFHHVELGGWVFDFCHRHTINGKR